MSAWIVDKALIDLLVEAFYRYEVPDAGTLTPTALGRILWKENHRSVNHRYNESTTVPGYAHTTDQQVYGHDNVGKYRAWGTVKELARNPVFLLKQLHCFDYQSCECEDWKDTVAGVWCEVLEKAVLTSISTPGREVSRSEEYDHYPWGIDYRN